MKEQARARARQLAREFTQRGDATGWFEELYLQAQGSEQAIHWADMEVNPNLVEWLDRRYIGSAGKRALVVGCGLGDDPEELARRGFKVVAFDVAPTAIAWCRQRFPQSPVEYVVADVFDPPREWRGSFDFVLEAYTLQVLPAEVRSRAMTRIAGLLAPGGMLLVICRGRSAADPPGELPWPLTMEELETFTDAGLRQVHVEDYFDQEEPPVRRFRVEYQRTSTTDHVTPLDTAPLFALRDYQAPSLFTPQNLLREARRQKGLPEGRVPAICVFDPDGDLVDFLQAAGRTRRHPTWACYHTVLETFVQDETEYGIIGRVVGAPFAVLVAEELFASGCQLLISITSAGQILPLGQPPYVVLIDKALRDEGTSYHYLPPAPYSSLHPLLREMVSTHWDHGSVPLHMGASWTTDAPFRETEALIAQHRTEGILAVEMEAAALYALAQARQYQIICFAHVTNQMGQTESDFEKGEASGSETALSVVGQTAHCWRQRETELTEPASQSACASGSHA